jgi:hypothetical protein
MRDAFGVEQVSKGLPSALRGLGAADRAMDNLMALPKKQQMKIVGGMIKRGVRPKHLADEDKYGAKVIRAFLDSSSANGNRSGAYLMSRGIRSDAGRTRDPLFGFKDIGRAARDWERSQGFTISKVLVPRYVYHGTSTAWARKAARQGFKTKANPELGDGVYVTPDRDIADAAAVWNAGRHNANRVKQGKITRDELNMSAQHGTVLRFVTKGKPKAQRPMREWGGGTEMTYDPKQLIPAGSRKVRASALDVKRGKDWGFSESAGKSGLFPGESRPRSLKSIWANGQGKYGKYE